MMNLLIDAHCGAKIIRYGSSKRLDHSIDAIDSIDAINFIVAIEFIDTFEFSVFT